MQLGGMNYTTVFRWPDKRTLLVFYRYGKLGLVPTEVSFTYRGKAYSTVRLMQLLAGATPPAAPQARAPFRLEDWYGPGGRSALNKRLFVALTRMLEPTSARSTPMH